MASSAAAEGAGHRASIAIACSSSDRGASSGDVGGAIDLSNIPSATSSASRNRRSRELALRLIRARRREHHHRAANRKRSEARSHRVSLALNGVVLRERQWRHMIALAAPPGLTAMGEVDVTRYPTASRGRTACRPSHPQTTIRMLGLRTGARLNTRDGRASALASSPRSAGRHRVEHLVPGLRRFITDLPADRSLHAPRHSRDEARGGASLPHDRPAVRQLTMERSCAALRSANRWHQRACRKPPVNRDRADRTAHVGRGDALRDGALRARPGRRARARGRATVTVPGGHAAHTASRRFCA